MNHIINRLPDVQKRTGLARSTIYFLISQGKFPKPIRLGARSVGWISADLDAWVQSRIDNSEA